MAFAAFQAACRRAGIDDNRIGQTIGDHPLSKGYHHADGFITVHGVREPYCAATDLGAWDLSAAQLQTFLKAL